MQARKTSTTEIFWEEADDLLEEAEGLEWVDETDFSLPKQQIRVMPKSKDKIFETPKGFRIAIASGKGGTGKTTLSVNLSRWLAQKQKVRLVDLDVEEPNSGLFLAMSAEQKRSVKRKIPAWDKSSCLFCGNCQKVCNFNSIIQTQSLVLIFQQLCHSCRACFELCPAGALQPSDYTVGQVSFFEDENLQFIEGRLDVGQEQAVPVIAEVLDYLDENPLDEGLTIIDSPPGAACPAVETFGRADFVLLVVEPTPFGLYDGSLAIKVTQELGKPVAVVVNKWSGDSDLLQEFVAENSVEVITKIGESKKIAENYSNGQLIYEDNPEVQQNLQEIYDYFCAKVEALR